ncbi:hypothetical protein [Rhodoferax ferrireducens]|uniref:hypothetical protein n=1 Tax=Rhodoferax ferrireducens TaxID=192843 RepID=UPI000E0D2276|nr:hypothetical protein [Rhodoferax ferrireducens]
MKRTPFKRKLPAAYVKAERISPVYARLTVKVNMPRVGDAVVILPKEDIVRSEPYRRLVAARPCINCHIEGYSQAAHPPPTGKGIKEDDRECFPLCCIHPGADGELVPGCHADFDNYRLVPASDVRALAASWGAQIRKEIRDEGKWPKGLPHFEEQTALELAS